MNRSNQIKMYTKKTILCWLSLYRLCLILIFFFALFLPSEIRAQGIEINNEVFHFKIHESLKDTIIKGQSDNSIRCYSDGEIFLKIETLDKYPNAAKYADMMENFYLDQENVYTKRIVDSLDGIPVIHLIREDKSKTDPFIQHFYLFDDGIKSYQISISGFQANRLIMENKFQVSKNSFRFKTKEFTHTKIKITLPVIFSTTSTGFWSGAYSKDETTQILIMANHLAEIKYESKLKELDKKFKSLKNETFKKDELNIAGMTATKYTSIHDEKFNTGSEKRCEYHYVIEHPSGGVFYIWYKAKPGAIEILDRKFENCLQEIKFL